MDANKRREEFNSRVSELSEILSERGIKTVRNVPGELVLCLMDSNEYDEVEHVHLIIGTLRNELMDIGPYWNWTLQSPHGFILAQNLSNLTLDSKIDELFDYVMAAYVDWRRFIEDITIENPEGMGRGSQ